MNILKHYKMFKKGKNWCFMAIATVAVAIGALNVSTQANADVNSAANEPVAAAVQSQSTAVSASAVNSDTAANGATVASASNSAVSTNVASVSTSESPASTSDKPAQTSAEPAGAVQSAAPKAEAKLQVAAQPAQLNGWQTQNGQTYYYRNGQKVTGTQTIDNAQYYFNGQGQQLKDYFLTQNNHTYYFQKNGQRLNNGFYQNWGHTYYFGKDGARLDNSVYTNWGHQYYFGNDGALVQNNDVTVNGKKYHADSAGVLTVKNNTDAKVDRALSQRGVPYVWGGNTPAGFDCSGLVQWAYGLGASYRTTYQQATLGIHKRDVMNAPKGSLLFFGSDGAPYHVAISLGNGTYVHAPEPGDVVKIGYSKYFKPSFYINM